MMTKMRLDTLLVSKGLCQSREQAKKLIMAGSVTIDGRKADKAGSNVAQTALLEIKQPLPFVSRGGFKLAKAFDCFDICVQDKLCADLGASTGGFTDCLLQHGARQVYAIDVGYGQLDWRLRNDERVIVMERTNARAMQPDWFCAPLEFACMDVSFISIKLMLAPLIGCLGECADVVALIKPQFEAGREKVGKKGVVRDIAVHAEVMNEIMTFSRKQGYLIAGLDRSPIKGPEGNVEFLIHLRNYGEHAWQSDQDAQCAAQMAQPPNNGQTEA